MNIGITKTTNYGEFVQSGATSEHAQYFHDDAGHRSIVFYNGALSVGGSSLHHQVNAFATAQTDVVIELDQDFVLDRLISIPVPSKSGATLTIRSANPSAPVTLKRGVSGSLFTVPSNASLILEDIIIDGDKDGSFSSGGGSLVYVSGGAFTMREGAVLRNNSSSSGGGVSVGGGIFTMEGGTISGNTATSYGGGVFINGGTFNMNGGEINGNNAYSYGGGVNKMLGTFTMNAGKINGNNSSFYGGGVYATGSFYMSGGSISGNTASSAGGGMYVCGGSILSGGTFTMSGGIINGNTAVSGGGVIAGTIIMNDGEISGNNAYSAGGGVEGIITMNGGKISGNHVNGGYGGGVYGTITMNGGEISRNNAYSGGGVYGSITMTGGEISDNTAYSMVNNDYYWGSGGGVNVNGGGTFTMSGGKICRNIASNGGGVYGGNGSISLGGTAIIIDNNNTRGAVADNVSLFNNEYITLDSPSEGMNVGITKIGNNGIFVQSGAIADHAQYFSDDIAGKAIFFYKGALLAGGSYFHYQVETYATAEKDVIIEVEQDIVLDQLVNIPANANGKILTIRSANQSTPVTLKRGVSGTLFTVLGNATLVLENIIIDGDNDGDFAFSGGSLVYVSETWTGSTYLYGTFVMNDGAVLRNNTGYGGGVCVDHGGTFIMSGGLISGNTSGGNSNCSGGSVAVNYTGTFTMTGGVVVGVGSIYGIIRNYGAFNFNANDYNASNNGIIIAWNKPTSTNPFIYTEGTNTHLTMLPTEGATAVWTIKDGKSGISYKNGENEGFVEIADVKVKIVPTITWPTSTAITYGNSISTSTFNGGTASVAGSFEWTNGSVMPTVTNNGYSVTFRPSDTEKYLSVTTEAKDYVAITVNPKNITISSATALSKTYDGNESANAGAISFAGLANSETLILGTDYIVSAEFTGGNYNAGNSKPYAYTVAIIPNAKTNNYNLSANTYNGTNGVINKANPTYTIPTNLTANYGDLLSNVKLPTGWSWQETGTVGEAGMQTHKATFTPEDAKNYNVITDIELTITVNPLINTPQDNLDIAAAKATIESTDFGSIPQSTLNSQGMARGFIEDIITELDLNDVTYTVVNKSFTAATAGTANNIFGTNGLYTFTIKLNKGIGTEQEYAGQLVIVATKYEPPIQGELCKEGEELVDGDCLVSPIRIPQLASSNQATQTHNGINLQATSNAVVEIYGLKGNLISRQNFGSGVYTVSFGHLPKGMYIVQVKFGSEKQILRVPVR